MGGAAFRACVEQALAPTPKPGEVVIVGNLLPHSPGFNPIENTFAKLKALLRAKSKRYPANAAVAALIATQTVSDRTGMSMSRTL